jgi:hypothetical protein
LGGRPLRRDKPERQNGRSMQAAAYLLPSHGCVSPFGVLLSVLFAA